MLIKDFYVCGKARYMTFLLALASKLTLSLISRVMDLYIRGPISSPSRGKKCLCYIHVDHDPIFTLNKYGEDLRFYEYISDKDPFLTKTHYGVNLKKKSFDCFSQASHSQPGNKLYWSQQR